MKYYFLIWMTSLFVGCAKESTDRAQSLVQNVVKITVATDDYREAGFGFISGERNGKLFIVTAAHVVEVAKDLEDAVKVEYKSEYEEYPAKIIRLQYEADVALVEVEKPQDFNWQSNCLGTAEVGDEVAFIGRDQEWYIPQGNAVGTIYRVQNNQIEVDVNSVQPGCSGAPLVNRSGIVGMIIEDDGSQCVAIDIEQIRQTLSDFPYFFTLNRKRLSFGNDNKAAGSKVLQEDVEAYKISEEKGDIKTYVDYLKDFPEGEFKEVVERRIRELSAQNLQQREEEQAIQNKELRIPENFERIPGGTFLMGCMDEQSDECQGNEKPAHVVTVSDYLIGKYEVTVREFAAFVKETHFQTDSDKKGWSNIWNGSKWEKKNGVNWKCNSAGTMRSNSEYNHPVIHVSWNDAIAYCQWLSIKDVKTYRLPTEAEWEYAARRGNWPNQTKYGGSNTIDEVAWYTGNSDNQTHPVGKKKANGFGLYDMSGNVWEWCQDWYGSDYYETCRQLGMVENPYGLASGSARVFRGGGWDGSAQNCRVSYRTGSSPDDHGSNVGFRLVVDL